MRVTLTGLQPGTQYAAQFRSYNGDGYSDWSQIKYFTTTGDTMPPAQVQNLSWTVTGGTFTATWDKVVFNKDGSVCNDFHDYQITISDGDPATAVTFHATSESFSFTLDQNQKTFGRIQPTLTITVQGRDYTGNLGDVTTATATDPVPQKPSTPVVSIYLGQLVVAWDGLDFHGLGAPYNYDYTEVHVSTTAGFTPDATTLNTQIFGAAKVIVSNLTYGTPYYVRFVSINKIGGASVPSDQGVGTPVRISGLDIQDGAISVNQINFSDQIGGPKAFYQTTAPTTGMKTNDIWYDKSHAYQPYVYDGTQWVVNNDIGVISGTKIVTGTLTADSVGSNLLITAAANIGTAVIDSTKIGSVNAGTITVGQMKSGLTVNIDGTTRPAWIIDTGGNATFSSASLLGTLTVGTNTNTAANNANISMQSANYLPGSAGWAVKGDGSVEFNTGVFRGSLASATFSANQITSGTLTSIAITSTSITGTSTITGATITGGTIQTASSGSRVVIDTTGLNLYNSSGINTVNLSTSGNAVITGLYKSNYSGMRVEIDGNYKRANAANPNAPYAGIRMFGSSDTLWGEMGTGGDPLISGLTTLQMISPGATASNGSYLRLRSDNSYTLFGNATGEILCTGSLKLQGSVVNITSTSNFSSNAYFNNHAFFTSGSYVYTQRVQNYNTSYLELNGSPVYFNVTGGSGVDIAASSSSGSPFLVFEGYSSSNGANGALKFMSFSGSFGLSVLDTFDSGYGVVRASGFLNTSDVAAKSNITPAQSLLAQVVSTPVYEYDMAAHNESGSRDNKKVKKGVQRRRGILAHEAPSMIVSQGSQDPAAGPHEKLAAVDVYAMTATAWGAIKELHDTIEELKQEIATLKGTP